MIVLACASLAAVTATGAGCGGATAGRPSAEAERTIPAELLPIFRAAEGRYGVPWNVLAAINKVETDFGRNLGPSSMGAVGWMQFMPATWAQYGVDADGDGRADPNDPADAIFAAGAYVRASGASEDLRGAIFAYNHADWYVEQVLDTARTYAAAGLPAAEPDDACLLGLAEPGAGVRIAPGANLPGRALAPATVA